MRASNAIYGVTEGRPITRTVPVRAGVTVTMTIMLVISVLIIVVTGPVARHVGDALGIGDAAVLAWSIAKWPVLLVVVWLMFSLLYWACPNVKQSGRPGITPGAAIAIGLWLVCSGLFALYVSFSGSYNKTYGSLATVIIFLVWLWISNIALLMGLEFDAERQRERLMQAGFRLISSRSSRCVTPARWPSLSSNGSARLPPTSGADEPGWANQTRIGLIVGWPGEDDDIVCVRPAR